MINPMILFPVTFVICNLTVSYTRKYSSIVWWVIN